jgi:hypothetical protein
VINIKNSIHYPTLSKRINKSIPTIIANIITYSGS